MYENIFFLKYLISLSVLVSLSLSLSYSYIKDSQDEQG